MAEISGKKEMIMGVLHIYPQGVHHDDVLIVGDREALTVLSSAIFKARILVGVPHSEDVYVNDGEGYSVRVLCLPEVPDNLAVPYTEDYAKARWGGAVGPHELFKEKP